MDWTMTVLTLGSRVLPAAMKISAVKKRAALMPDICWKNMSPIATSKGLAAHQRNTSENLDACACCARIEASRRFNSGSMS